MSVREYIGARYVPVFADPIQWDSTSVYEPLTVVTNEGASYVSRRMVPEGIQLSNTDYWVLWADFNAQLQHYIDEVETFDGRIDALEDALPVSEFSSQATVDDALDALNDKFPIATSDIADDAITSAKIDDGAVTGNALDASLSRSISSLLQKDELILIGDSWSEFYSGQMGVSLGAYLNCTVHNYAVSGMGFVHGTTNFQEQADTAYADTTVIPENVKYIVIIGGSNDFNNGIRSGAAIANAIDYICNKLLPKFPKAQVHVSFNTRFVGLDGNIGKLNAQNKLFNDATNSVVSNGYRAIMHPGSVGWFSKDSFRSDSLSHIDQANTKKYAQYLAGEITGQQLDYMSTGRTTVSLNQRTEISGNCYFMHTNKHIYVCAYVNVTEDYSTSSGRVGVKYDSGGLFPMMLWTNPEVNQLSNRLVISLGRVDGPGSLNLELVFKSAGDYADTVYLTSTNSSITTLPAGRYYGSGFFSLI